MRWGWLLLLVSCAGVDDPGGVVDDAGLEVDALKAVVGLDAARPAEDGSAPPDVFVPADAAPETSPPQPIDLAVALPPVDAAVPDAAVVDAAVPDAAQPDASRCGAEACNDVDDDCDGRVDEDAVCGAYIAQHCAVTVGWADENRGPAGVSASWSTCPAQDRQMNGDVRCTRTRRDGRFVRLDLGGDVDDNDQIGVALHCDDAALPGLAAWVQSHCGVFLGHADNNRGVPGGVNWGACPPALSSDAVPRCTSSGFDGSFRALRFTGDVDGNDDLGLAWICQDPAQPERALAAQSAVVVWLGWADENRGANDGAEGWGVACPGRGDQRACVSTAGDGVFHTLDLGGNVNDDDDLGIALRAR